MRTLKKHYLLEELRLEDGCALHLVDKVKENYGVTLVVHGVYPLLRSMEREGVLQSYESDDPEREGRPRRMYRLTDRGRATLDRWTKAVE